MTGNENAVMSAYPKSVAAVAQTGNVPVVCNTKFTEDGFVFMPKHDGMRMVNDPKTPILTHLWAAGMSFSKAHRVHNVPYDGFTPYLFDGEEFGLGLRMFTHGYDVYAPMENLVWHVYQTGKKDSKGEKAKFWEDKWNERYPIQKRSARRIWAMMGFPLDDDYDDTDLDKYGLGTKRTVAQYERWTGIDLATRNVAGGMCDKVIKKQLKVVPYDN